MDHSRVLGERCQQCPPAPLLSPLPSRQLIPGSLWSLWTLAVKEARKWLCMKFRQAKVADFMQSRQVQSKHFTAINWSCWVKFFPCPIHYWTVNFVFVPARHSSSQMTALSIKEHMVTALQWELCQPCLPGGQSTSPPRNPGTHQHLNQYARVNYRGGEGLSRTWWWGSRANGRDRWASESHT